MQLKEHPVWAAEVARKGFNQAVLLQLRESSLTIGEVAKNTGKSEQFVARIFQEMIHSGVASGWFMGGNLIGLNQQKNTVSTKRC
jgi:hypothetical protein